MLRVDCAARLLFVDHASFRCEIGRCGAIPAVDKREGDGRTPIGDWPLRGAILRPDRGIVPPTRLPWRWMRPDDGWCDDPRAPAYNRPISLPVEWSAERMWRDDHVYDVVITVGHNDAPPVADAGSAIFLHLAGPGATEGCIAIDPPAMRHVLDVAKLGICLSIR